MTRRQYGSGSLFKRRDGRYVGRVELPRGPDGRRRQKTVSSLDPAVVKRELRRLSSTSRSQKPTDLSVGEWLDTWLKDARVRPRTHAGYRSIVERHLGPDLGAMQLVVLRPADVRDFARRQLERGLGARTVGHHLACLRTALQAAVRDELISRNPASLVKAPTVPRTEHPVLTESEVTRLLEAVKGDRLEALYVLAASTGMRQGELLGLEWNAVDLERAEVTVRQSLSWVDRRPAIVPPKTERSRRTIPLDERTVAALREHRKRSLASSKELEQGLVFTTEHGSPIQGSTATRAMQAWCKRAGIPVSGWHGLRHYVASKWANAGMPPRTLMAMLGHSQIGTTFELYAHTTTDDIREAMRRLA